MSDEILAEQIWLNFFSLCWIRVSWPGKNVDLGGQTLPDPAAKRPRSGPKNRELALVPIAPCFG